MADFDLTKVKKVVVAFDAQAANEKMEKGWVLIDKASGKDESGYPAVHYSLAWDKDGDPQH